MSNFTGQKLDWLTSVSFDRRVTNSAFRVAHAIAGNLNEETGKTLKLSAETIGFQIGHKGPKKVQRAINLLKACGWLDWHRTGSANVYTPNYSKVKATLEMIGRWRYEKRQRYNGNSPEIGHQCPSADKSLQTDNSVPRGRTPVSDNHLRKSPYKRVVQEVGSLRVEASGQKRAAPGGGRPALRLIDPRSK